VEKLDLLTLREVAHKLRVPPGSVYTNLSLGKFPIQHIKIGRLIRFFASDVEEYLKSLPKIGSNKVSP
jgi:excisionase family DNA binding protein